MNMENNFIADQQALDGAIANETIFHSVVTKLGRDGERDYMSVQIDPSSELNGGYVGRIYIEESDDEMQRRSLMSLLGQNVPFVVMGVDMDQSVLVCSRKKAQQCMKANMEKDIADQKVHNATVVKFMPFGAFVDIGGISGILRTSDFSDDYSEVSEYYNIGDRIPVICTEINERGRLSFRAVNVHHRSQPIAYDVQEGQIALGEIRSIRNLAKGPVCFVRIDTGLDCLCPQPVDFEVERNSNVAVQIREVKSENQEQVYTSDNPPQVRGRILRVL